MTWVKMGGYKIDCHIVAEDRMDLRPKNKNMSVGEDFIKPSTMEAARPAGESAGARAIKTLIFSFNWG